MSFKKLLFRYRRFRQRMGPRVFFYVILAFLAAAFGHYLGVYVPDTIVENVGRLDVQPVLASLSGTMLTISTFSLSIVVSANFNAVSSTTPRAFKLLLQDQGTQNMLSRFLGAFVFSTITLMILPLGYYGGGGRVFLLGFTIWIVISIIVSFIRWVMMIRELGSMSNALGKIENATRKSLYPYLKNPYTNCHPFTADTVPDLSVLRPYYCDIGEYIQLIDEASLQEIARSRGVQIYINLIEGDFVSSSSPLFYVSKDIDSVTQKAITGAFVLGDWRDIGQDPRFGVLMLYQTASKALSPGINDPGTAVECIHTAYRLLSLWRDLPEREFVNSHVYKRPINYQNLLVEFFDPITHDAGDMVSVHLAVIDTLTALHRHPSESVANAAAVEARRCFERAMALLQDERDKEILRVAYRKVGASTE